ncbi:unnamed protein product, partial [Ectocarpus sp. 12 AP-2014]
GGFTGHDQNGGGGDNSSCGESCSESIVTITIVGDGVDLVRLVSFGGETRDTSVGDGRQIDHIRVVLLWVTLSC